MGGSTTVRIDQEVLDMLKQVAVQTNSSVQSTLKKAVEEYRRSVLLREANAAYQVLRESPGWKDELEEREVWETALLDGEGDHKDGIKP